MTQSLKNVLEVIETEGEYEQALTNRTKNIKKFGILGPPDMCYLTKEFQKSLSLSKKEKIGAYHYVYGANMNNPACLSTYIHDILRQQENESNWFSNGKWTITKGIFCLYDAFNKVDIRVEVRFPGGFKFYGINQNQEVIARDENRWDTPFISSVLRSFNPQPVPVVKFYPEFPTHQAWNDFTKAVINLVSTGKDLDYPHYEQLTYKSSRIIHIVIEYLIKKRRLNIAIDFINSLIQIDPKYAAFKADILYSMDKIPETIRFLAPILEKNPHVANLLYIEAKCLMKCEQYEMALKLTKVVVQLAPDSFEAWLLLIEIYCQSKHYKEALITMNIIPVYYDLESNNGYYSEINPKNFTKPKTRNISDNFSIFLFEPSNAEDQKPLNAAYEDNNLFQNENLDLNEKALQSINKLPANDFNTQEMKLYKILIRMEREIGWDKLLSLRSQLFLMEADSSKGKQSFLQKLQQLKKIEDYEIYDKPLLIDESTLNSIPGLTINDSSDQAAKTYGCEKNPDQKNIEGNDSDDSNDSKNLPSFLQGDDNEITSATLKGNMKNIETAAYHSLKDWENQRPKKITEETEENADTEISEPSRNAILLNKKIGNNKRFLGNVMHIFDAKGIINFNTKKKKMCSKILEKLFVALYEDLTILYECEKEESTKKINHNDRRDIYYDDRIKSTNLLWIHRGILAERLNRIKFAQNAYFKVIEKDYNFYSYYRLYKLSIESGAILNGLICLSEILEEMEKIGIKFFNVIPEWITSPIYEMISKFGVTKFKELLKDLKQDKDPLRLILKDYEYWQVEGLNIDLGNASFLFEEGFESKGSPNTKKKLPAMTTNLKNVIKPEQKDISKSLKKLNPPK